MKEQRYALVTGASSGIGAAVARELAALGFKLVITARRRDRLDALAREIGALPFTLDVREKSAIDAFAAMLSTDVGRLDVLVNNAGLALGREPLAESNDDDWVQLLDTNVLGVARVTRALLPLLRTAPHAHIVMLGSVAGFDVYPGGASYTASKHALRAITRTLRLELNGEPIRITEIAPGMVETEFSVTRFRGDSEKAAGVYAGMTPLTAEDVAGTIGFAVSRPPHVNLDYIVIQPVAQASVALIARKNSGEAAPLRRQNG